MKRYLIALIPLLLLCSFIGTPTNQCSGRFAGPFGEYLSGPQLVTRTYNGLDIPDGTTSIHCEGCFSTIYGYGYEFRGPQGPATMAFTHMRMNLTLLVNGFVAQGNLIQHADVIDTNVSSYDGVGDFAGPSGRGGLTEAVGTFIAFDISVTPETIGLWRSDFQVSALMRMNANEDNCTSPNTIQVDGYWRGGVTFAVAQP